MSWLFVQIQNWYLVVPSFSLDILMGNGKVLLLSFLLLNPNPIRTQCTKNRAEYSSKMSSRLK